MMAVYEQQVSDGIQPIGTEVDKVESTIRTKRPAAGNSNAWCRVLAIGCVAIIIFVFVSALTDKEIKVKGRSLILVDYDRKSDVVFKFNTTNFESVIRSVHDFNVRVLVVIGGARLGKSTFCKYSLFSILCTLNSLYSSILCTH